MFDYELVPFLIKISFKSVIFFDFVLKNKIIIFFFFYKFHFHSQKVDRSKFSEHKIMGIFKNHIHLPLKRYQILDIYFNLGSLLIISKFDHKFLRSLEINSDRIGKIFTGVKSFRLRHGTPNVYCSI